MSKYTRLEKIAIISFIIVAPVLLLGNRNWFPEFYNPRFMGIMALTDVFWIILPRFIFRVKKTVNNLAQAYKAQDIFQSSWAASFILKNVGALGAFQLYKVGFQYDKALHFLVPFILTASFVHFASVLYDINIKKALISTVLIVFFSGFVWELIELSGDLAFGTQMLGQFREFIVIDTIWDLIWNTTGVLLAAGFYFKIEKIFNESS